MRIYLDTVGCRLNQSEIEAYARQFRLAGHTLAAHPEEADLAVINTCTVTTQADSDSRQKIRQVARSGVAQIIVTGCWATLNPSAAASLPGVARVVPNTTKDALVANLLGLPLESFELDPIERVPLPGARLRTRAFIKAQDGCDNACAYCITTLARGSRHSRALPEVLADVRAAVRGGTQEIVLTGVHLGSWGQDFDPPQPLHHLVETVLANTDARRVRLSSLEPWDLDERFFTLWENPRLCRHLHLPLQSGSAATLQRMRRKTTPQAFAALVKMARTAIPDVAITTDVMVGFPGEDEAEFAESLRFVADLHFSGGHVFTYSARPGTAAAHMLPQVPYPLRKIRNAQMHHALSEAALAFRQRFIGQEVSALWESAQNLTGLHGSRDWKLTGLTDNYLRVTAHAPEAMWNQISQVRLTAISERGLFGQLS
jgi:threonylcarbamoyladenosine tRNA methylthiotransferase MtaB